MNMFPTAVYDSPKQAEKRLQVRETLHD